MYVTQDVGSWERVCVTYMTTHGNFVGVRVGVGLAGKKFRYTEHI